MCMMELVMALFRPNTAACLILALLAQSWAFAADPETSGIPRMPSAPPVLSKKLPVEEFSCTRMVRYRGQTINCDSNLRWDGENLRPIFEDNPAAINELNAYQSNRRSLNNLAY